MIGVAQRSRASRSMKGAVAEAVQAADAALIDLALAGDRRALARLLSVVEAGGARSEAVVQVLYPRSGQAHVVGFTGAPGTGKSTLVGQVARELRQRGRRVAVIAVDPTSPFSGGALLGDRLRMSGLAGDPDVFIRSMATRASSGGGLAEQTAAVAAVLAAAGFDAVLLETVGAGQDELAVAQEAQTVVVVTAPGLGDEVQALKAGILEIADVLVVNKADREGADRLAAELRLAAGRPSGQPAVPVIKTVATQGAGVVALVEALEAHHAWLESSGRGRERAARLAEQQLLRWAAAKAVRRARTRAAATGVLAQLVEAVAARRLAPAAAAEQLLALALPAISGAAAGSVAGEPPRAPGSRACAGSDGPAAPGERP